MFRGIGLGNMQGEQLYLFVHLHRQISLIFFCVCVFYGSAHTAFALKDGILCAQMISCQVCYSYSIGKRYLQRNRVVNCFRVCLVNLVL